MEFIKEEREDIKIEETFTVKQEETEEQTKMTFIKEESENIRIEETFSVKHEETEEQTVCSGVWYKYCLKQALPEDEHDFSSEDNESDEDMHEYKDYVPDSDSESDSDTSSVNVFSLSQGPLSGNIEAFHTRTKTTGETTDEAKEDKAGVNGTNYCYVCQKPQSKLARHLETHKTEAEVMEALSYPKRSVKRRQLLEKLRNRGNFQHNLAVLKNGTGHIKLKRTSKQSQFIHCVYCKGMFSRKELWRHARRCHFMPERASGESTKPKVLGLATTAQSVFSEGISQGVWKLLDPMRPGDITTVVRNDFGILQLAQTLYNKHGADTTKYEYIRQKLRELARVLLVLRGDSIYTVEDAVKSENFHKVVKAVKKVSGFDEENNSYTAPSLALKIGHSLQKIADIIHCRALITENEDLIKSTEAFKSLYSTKWCELVSPSAMNTLPEKKLNKPLTFPFTQDVQLLHKGCHGSIQGKSLDEIHIEDQIQLTDTEDDADDEPAGTSSFGRQKKVSTSTQEACQNGVTASVDHRGTNERKKRMWSKAEVAAVIRHFKVHIAKGHLATKSECLHCKSAEEHVLQNRSVQNIRDFVRNRGIRAKMRSRYESAVCTT